jgi:hypothetical protein
VGTLRFAHPTVYSDLLWLDGMIQTNPRAAKPAQ